MPGGGQNQRGMQKEGCRPKLACFIDIGIIHGGIIHEVQSAEGTVLVELLQPLLGEHGVLLGVRVQTGVFMVLLYARRIFARGAAFR